MIYFAHGMELTYIYFNRFDKFKYGLNGSYVYNAKIDTSQNLT